jgi:hypothetical protein
MGGIKIDGIMMEKGYPISIQSWGEMDALMLTVMVDCIYRKLLCWEVGAKISLGGCLSVVQKMTDQSNRIRKVCK